MASGTVEQLEPWCRLDGKIIMVTGASSGLGAEFCLDLAKAGCRIVAAARRINNLNSLCHQMNTMNVPTGSNHDYSCRAIAVALDVTTDGSAIAASVHKAWDAFGHIDVLINNAGVTGQNMSSLDLGEEEWKHVVDTNLRGSWLVSKYVGGRMRDGGRGGSIINISSISGLNRALQRGAVAYASSKVALHSVTKVMALELGDYNIRVNTIAPGIFKSEITKDLVEKDWFKNVEKKTVPLRTFGSTDPALTSLVRYLVHDSSSFVSGNLFIVDAGFTLPGFPIFSSL